MDDKFLQELETELTDVGVDEVWKKQIGNKLIWLSPVTSTGNGKVFNVMSSDDAGPYRLFEAKKISLSYAIIGVGKTDLRPYRHSGPTFPVLDPRVGEKVKVDLPTYILHLMSGWGHDFIEIAFDILVDSMETYKKVLLKDITFDNVKDPMTELAELEDRAAVIREQLNLPPKVEMKTDDSHPDDVHSDDEDLTDGGPSEASPEPEEPEEAKTAFSPFDRVPEPKKPQEESFSSPPVRTVPVPMVPAIPQQMGPQGLQGTTVDRTSQYSAIEGSVDNPFKATPSVAQEVVEQSARGRAPLPPPEVDPIRRNVNPRFKPQTR